MHNQSERFGMFGIYFIKDVLITESKKCLQHLRLFYWFGVYRIQGGFPAWVFAFEIFPAEFVFKQ